MAERPLLLLPEAFTTVKAKKGGGGGGPIALSPERQQVRLGAAMKSLEQAFEARRASLKLGVSGISPESVLVLETAGTVEEFAKAVGKIAGLELLLEYDELEVPPDEDFFVEKKEEPASSYTGRVYAVFSDVDAFKQLKKLWDEWQSGQRLKTGFTKWRDVFSLLRTIRPWDIKDRLEETGVLEDWARRELEGARRVSCEIELWFRENESLRNQAATTVRNQVVALGGFVFDECIIAEIRYHGLCAELPIDAVKKLLSAKDRSGVALVRCEEIEFFRPSGQAVTTEVSDIAAASEGFVAVLPSGQPSVALLDGLPLQAHSALANRLIVDDPDGHEAGYAAAARIHGTLMSSLVIWGDLNSSADSPIPTPLYVRPILVPEAVPDWVGRAPRERMPERTLGLDLVRRAILRIVEQFPAPKGVSTIGFAVGMSDRPFLRTMSPLARLIDWLSWKHELLFIVSAGNHLSPLIASSPWRTTRGLEDVDRARVTLASVVEDTRNRRLLSPAEAMNALSVGSIHSDLDASISSLPNTIDMLLPGLPSPFSAHGLGYRRSVKPDLVLSGGRIAFQTPLLDNDVMLSYAKTDRTPGHKVAAPGTGPGDIGYVRNARGTSNAAALLTRRAAFLDAVIADLRGLPDGERLKRIPTSVILKCLLAHGARWDVTERRTREVLGKTYSEERIAEHLTRAIGFGLVQLEAVEECAPNRVTAIGGGRILKDQGIEHRFPLPPSLSGKRGWRALTVSLAWLTPINPGSYKWRQASLWFETPRSKLKLDRHGPEWRAAQRGTLQHEVFEEEAASAFVDGNDILVKVSCRQDAPGLSGEMPYAIAVTLEVASEIGLDIYTEVKSRLAVRPRVSALRTR